MAKKKTTVHAPAPTSDPKICKDILTKIGNVVLANFEYMDQKKTVSPFLIGSMARLVEDEYKPKCGDTFENVAEKIRDDVFNQVHTQCLKLDSPAKISDCVRLLERENPIVLEDRLQEIWGILQLQRIQAMEMLKKISQEGDDGGDDGSGLPSSGDEADWIDSYRRLYL